MRDTSRFARAMPPAEIRRAENDGEINVTRETGECLAILPRFRFFTHTHTHTHLLLFLYILSFKSHKLILVHTRFATVPSQFGIAGHLF